MRSAITDLAAMEDSVLFAQIAEGAALVVANVVRLNVAAHCLNAASQRSVAATLDVLAGEEASKVLVLLDAVRCPPERATREKVLRRFNDHVAKGIYAKACRWVTPTLKDLRTYVEAERASHHLDGPHGFDWVVKNEILGERDRQLYVDLVGYFEAGCETRKREWVSPYGDEFPFGLSHQAPEVVRVVEALHRAGATSQSGLDVIAKCWRGFEPDSATTYGDVFGRNVLTLNMLEISGVAEDARPNDGRRVANGWPWPLWSLDLGSQRKNIDELRLKQGESLDRFVG